MAMVDVDVDGRWSMAMTMAMARRVRYANNNICANCLDPRLGAVKLMPTVASPDYVGHCVSNCL